MSFQKPSRFKRFFNFVAFRIVPVLLILGIIWSGYQVAQAVVERVNDFVLVSQRGTAYAATGTALAVKFATSVPTQTATETATSSSTPTPSLTSTDTPTSTATNTVTASPTATNTATQPATETAVLVPTETPLVVAQAGVFATNTPHTDGATALATNTPLIVATNTPAVIATSTLVEPPTMPPIPTFTATEPPTATPTLPPAPAETATPRPLPTLLRPADPNVQQAGGTAVPTAVQAVDRHGFDLVNILLLGGDEQLTNDNFMRTDTMIILSINRTTGTVAMLSLPRDLYVYIPNGMMQRLNVAYAIGESIGWTDGGWGMLRQTIFYNFGINVHFYALVNFSGFAEVIDTVGGVDVGVDCAIKDLPLIGSEVPAAARTVDEVGTRVLDVGYYHFSGAEALWYARSRENSSDFDRGRRQQQILRAIWRKARSTGQLANLPNLWNEGLKLVKTNLGFEDMVGLLPIALNLDPARIENFTLVRTYHTTPWQTPQGDFVQIPNYDPLRQLLEDFYQPPTENQIQLRGATITVRNGTANDSWDLVAAERLAWSGFNAVAMGAADNTGYSDTILIDRTGQEKGSSRADIAKILNVKPENIRIEPDANREADFEVILGSGYNSCTVQGILPVNQ